MGHRHLKSRADGHPDDDFDLGRSLEQNGVATDEAHRIGFYSPSGNRAMDVLFGLMAIVAFLLVVLGVYSKFVESSANL